MTKGIKPALFSQFIIIEIEAKAAANDTVVTIATSIPRIASWDLASSNPLRALAPNIAGMASKSENRAAAVRLYPRNLAIVIVKPDLLAPGIRANT